MIEAPTPKVTWKTAVAALAAYVLVLHGMIVGAFMAPPGLSPDQLVITHLCSGAPSSPGDTAPDTPTQPHQNCALCGVGQCGMALPAGVELLWLWPKINALAVFATVDTIVPTRHRAAAQPRGFPVRA